MEHFSANLVMGFGTALSLQNLWWCFFGVLVGTVVGVLPGLGTVSTMAILLPMTFGMDPIAAIIMLSGVFYGSAYGGSTTSILVNVPGEGTSIMTCLDGYPMARQGRAKAALATAAIGSFFAGTVCAVALMFLAIPISQVGMKLGPPEYFAIMFLSLTMVGSLAADFPVKGIFMAILGLLLATVGTDAQSGQARFTFGSDDLVEGVNVIVVAVGMFGVTVVLDESERIWRTGFKPPRDKITGSGLWITWSELKESFMPYIRGTAVGFLTGLLPGMGGMTATVLAYGIEKQVSPHPEKFGKGAIEGVAAVEASNNAATGGALIPLLTLGMPSSASTAMLLGAFVMYGLRPGPLLMETNPQLVWAIIASLYIGNVILLILNLPLVNLFAKLLDVPEALLNALVLALCFIGVYCRKFSLTEVFLMIVFGVFGYFTKKSNYPPAPLLLGLVLGDMLEQAFRRSMNMSLGDPTLFFTRPISLGIMIAAISSVVYTFIRFYWRRLSLRSNEKSAGRLVLKNVNKFDLLFAILVIPVSVFLMFVAYDAPRPTMLMIIGPHMWPIGLLVLLIVCAILLCTQTINEGRKPLPSDDPPSIEIEEDGRIMKTRLDISGHIPSETIVDSAIKWYRKPECAVVLTILGLLFYGAFLESLGFIVCTSLLVIYQSRVLQRGRWVRNIITAVLFSVIIYVTFSKVLLVTLPSGLWGGW